MVNELQFKAYNIYQLIDNAETFDSLVETCKLRGLHSLKQWYVNNILTTKMGIKDVTAKPDIKEVAEEFKRHVPEFVLLINYSEKDYLRLENLTKAHKDVMIEVREAVNNMVHAECSRMFFFNPKQKSLSAEIQAMDETEYAMICFTLKALKYPVEITRA